MKFVLTVLFAKVFVHTSGSYNDLSSQASTASMESMESSDLERFSDISLGDERHSEQGSPSKPAQKSPQEHFNVDILGLSWPGFYENYLIVADEFDRIVSSYFATNFGTSGKEYLKKLTVVPTEVKKLPRDLIKEVFKAAKKIVVKYSGEGSMFGSRKTHEISFRLHRVLGALQLIAHCKHENRDEIIKQVLDGANASLFFTPTKWMRGIIGKVGQLDESKQGPSKLELIDLIGKIAWSKKAKPSFNNNLFTLIENLMKPGVQMSEGFVSKIDEIVNANSTIDEIETATKAAIKSELEHTKTQLKQSQK